MHLRNAVIAIAAAAALSACQTNPYTGRKTVNLLSANQEMSLGEEAFAEIKSTEKLITSGAQYEQVKRVAGKIANAADELARKRGNKPSFAWEVVLIDSPEANAWCLPGGKMGVYTGILPITQSDAGLGVVLGHEVAHAVSHHGGRRVTENIGMQAAALLADVGLSNASGGTRQAVQTALGVGSKVGVALPFSRADESEADRIGLILMAVAGFDPREAPEFWKRMATMSKGGQPPQFLSTHPSHETRIAELQKWMPEAQQYYNARGIPSGMTPPAPRIEPPKTPTLPPASAKPATQKPPIPKSGGGS